MRSQVQGEIKRFGFGMNIAILLEADLTIIETLPDTCGTALRQEAEDIRDGALKSDAMESIARITKKRHRPYVAREMGALRVFRCSCLYLTKKKIGFLLSSFGNAHNCTAVKLLQFERHNVRTVLGDRLAWNSLRAIPAVGKGNQHKKKRRRRRRHSARGRQTETETDGGQKGSWDSRLNIACWCRGSTRIIWYLYVSFRRLSFFVFVSAYFVTAG